MNNKTDIYSLYGDEYRGSYFKGLKGLSPEARKAYEEERANYLIGLDDQSKDDEFRTDILRRTLKSHPDPKMGALWTNRKTELDTWEKRNKIWSQLALTEDLDSHSEDADSSAGIGDWLKQMLMPSAKEREYEMAFWGTKEQQKAAEDISNTLEDNLVKKKSELDESTTIRNQAREYLQTQANEVRPLVVDQYNNLDEFYKTSMRQNLHQLSKELSPNYYGRYNDGTLGKDVYDALVVEYNSWLEVGGEVYANEMLSNYWQNYYAGQQTQGEKWAHATAKFGQEIASTAIMAAGVAKGLIGNPGGDEESYWKGIIDNEWTRYGADLFTTGQWNKEKQEEYKAKGWNKYDILNTVDQERALLSWNTPAELFAQYGFTAASMLLSAGLSGLAKGAAKGAVGLGLKAGLKSTEAGRKIIRGIIGAERVAQMTVPISVAIPEATLEALTTRDESLRSGLENIENTIAQQVDSDILNSIMADPAMAESFIKSRKDYNNYRFAFGTFQKLGETGKSVKVYSDLDKQRMYTLLREDPEFRAMYEGKYADYADGMLQQLQSSENTTLWTTFGLNMAVLGALNNSLQATQQALGVRRALGKAGANRFANAVDLIQTDGNKWKALAKNVTKKEILKDRLKETIGEGGEEMAQGAISAISEGMADDKVTQYFQKRYNSKEPLDAFAEDTWQMLVAGLQNGGEKLVSRDAFKEGLYGTLSTLLGGPSVNFNMNVGKKGENESYYDMIMRNSPISLRGIYEVAFSSAEQKARQAENQRVADTINNFLNKEENKNVVFDIVSNLESTRAFNDAIANQDEKSARDHKVDVLFSTASMLSSMRGTGFYDIVMETLKARTNFNRRNLDNEASNESIAVEEYRLKTGSKEYSETILEEIKSSAQTMLDIVVNAEKETANIRRVYGDNVSMDVQNALVNNRLHIKNTEDRIIAIENELKAIDFSEVDGVTKSNVYSNTIKKGFARWGNPQEAQEKQQQLKKGLSLLNEILAELNANTEISKEEREYEAKKIANQKKAKEAEIEALEDYLEEAGQAGDLDNIALSMQDIANLDTESQYALLNATKNGRKLSNRQRREIEKFIARGTKHDSQFKNKLSDLRSLKQSLENYSQTDFYLMTNPKILPAIAETYRRKTKIELEGKKYEYLSDNSSEANENYGSFMRALLDARTEATSEDQLEAINTAAKQSQFWMRYQEYEKEFDDFVDKVEKTKWYAGQTEQRRQDIDNMLISMFRDGTPFNSRRRVHNTISKIDLSNAEALTAAYREKFESYKLQTSEEFQAVNTVMDIFNILAEMQKTEDEFNSRPTVPTADENTGQPATPVATAPTGGPTVTPPQPSVINNIIESLRKAYADNTAILDALSEIEAMATNFSKDTLIEDIDNAISEASKPVIKDTLIYIRNLIKAGNPQSGKSKSVVTNNPNPNAGEIETFSTTDLGEMKEKWGGEKTRATLADIYNFLSSPEGYAAIREYKSQKKALKFYVPAELDEEIRLKMGSQYMPEIEAPVVVLMPYSNGSVTISGKKYQPIGFLPSAINQSKSGAANTETIRKSLMNQDGSIKIDTIAPIQANSWQVPGKAPEHFDPSQPNTNVRDLVQQEDQMSIDEFAKAMSVDRPIQTIGLEEGDKKRVPQIVVNIPNYKKSGETTPIAVFITKAEDVRDESGKNLFDYLIEGNQEKALSFNWRIQQVAELFKTILGNESLEEANEEALKNITNELNKRLSRYVRFSGSFKLHLDSNPQSDGTNKISLSLGLSNGAKAIVLDDVAKITDEEKNSKVFELLQNILLTKDKTGAKKLSSTGQFMIYQVDYKSIEKSEAETNTESTPNIFATTNRAKRATEQRLHRIKQDIQAGLFSVSKASLEYRAEGLKFSLPIQQVEEYSNPSSLSSPSNYTPSTTVEAPVQSATTNQGDVVEATTGEVVEKNEVAVQPETAQVTATETNTLTEETPAPKRRQRGSREYSGSYDTIGSTTIRRSSDKSIVPASKLLERLRKDGITKEKWDSMIPAEKQRIIDCC